MRLSLIRKASEEYAYKVDVPEGGRVSLTNDGGAEVLDGAGTTLLSVPAPWAKDANGKAVPTHFEVSPDRKSLIQVVTHKTQDGVAYPVVSDPIWFVVSGAIFWWAVRRCGAGGSISAIAAYASGDRSRWALGAQGAAGCVASFIGGWGILRNVVRVVRW